MAEEPAYNESREDITTYNPWFFRYLGMAEPKEPIYLDELVAKAQAYAEDMMQALDRFNTENPLPEGEQATTAPDRRQLMSQFEQFFCHYIAEQRGVTNMSKASITSGFPLHSE